MRATVDRGDGRLRLDGAERPATSGKGADALDVLFGREVPATPLTALPDGGATLTLVLDARLGWTNLVHELASRGARLGVGKLDGKVAGSGRGPRGAGRGVGSYL